MEQILQWFKSAWASVSDFCVNAFNYLVDTFGLTLAIVQTVGVCLLAVLLIVLIIVAIINPKKRKRKKLEKIRKKQQEAEDLHNKILALDEKITDVNIEIMSVEKNTNDEIYKLNEQEEIASQKESAANAISQVKINDIVKNQKVFAEQLKKQQSGFFKSMKKAENTQQVINKYEEDKSVITKEISDRNEESAKRKAELAANIEKLNKECELKCSELELKKEELLKEREILVEEFNKMQTTGKNAITLSDAKLLADHYAEQKSIEEREAELNATAELRKAKAEYEEACKKRIQTEKDANKAIENVKRIQKEKARSKEVYYAPIPVASATVSASKPKDVTIVIADLNGEIPLPVKAEPVKEEVKYVEPTFEVVDLNKLPKDEVKYIIAMLDDIDFNENTETDETKIAEEESLKYDADEAKRIKEEEEAKAVEEEAKRIAEEEARKAAEEEAKRIAEEQARKAAEEEAKRIAEEQARKAAEEEAKRIEEEKARKAAEEEAKRIAEEQARKAAEEEAKRIAEEEARKAAEEEAKRIAEEEARKAAEEEAKRIAEEEARKAAEEEAKRIAEEEARKAAEEEAKRIAEEEARKAAEEEAKRIAEEEARKAAEEEAKRIAEEEARKAAEEEAKRIAEEEARKAAEEEAKRIEEENRIAAEQEALRLAEEQAVIEAEAAKARAEEAARAAREETKRRAEEQARLEASATAATATRAVIIDDGIPATPINKKSKYQKPHTRLVTKDSSKKKITEPTPVSTPKVEKTQKAGYNGKWEIIESEGSYIAKLHASNGGLLLTTKAYDSEKSLKSGINAIKDALAKDNVSISVTKTGAFVFRINASKNKVILESDEYHTRNQCENTLNSAKRFSTTAVISK